MLAGNTETSCVCLKDCFVRGICGSLMALEARLAQPANHPMPDSEAAAFLFVAS